MFNVGGGELLIILFVALVVLGPDKLPDAARKIGNVMGEIKRMSSGFQDEFKAAMDTPNKAVKSVRETVKGPGAPSSPAEPALGTAADAKEDAAPAPSAGADTHAEATPEPARPTAVPEARAREDDDIRPVDPTGAGAPVARDTARTDDPAA
jgi:sec-independent protein translocase protein TatB